MQRICMEIVNVLTDDTAYGVFSLFAQVIVGSFSSKDY